MKNNIFRNLKHFKTIIVLTKEQKANIALEFGDMDKFQVIPHHMPKSNQVEYRTRNPYRLIAVSRFEKIKNISEVIDAFGIINKEIPETELLIFGRRAEEQNYKDQIEKLRLNNKAKVFGFTTNVQKEFSEASVSLYTSN